MTDLATIIVVIAVSGILGLIALYFVIKSAVKNALYEDREFRAKVAKMVAERDVR